MSAAEAAAVPKAPETRAAEAQVKLADSAETLKDSAKEQEDSADRRTVLAADRTILAAERTYAAWVRTGLAALASGVGARAVLDKVVPSLLIDATGSILILFSAFCFTAAVWRDLQTSTRPPVPEIRRLPTWLLVAINAFLVLVAVAALVGVWTG
jgi:putative membrane protein